MQDGEYILKFGSKHFPKAFHFELFLFVHFEPFSCIKTNTIKYEIPNKFLNNFSYQIICQGLHTFLEVNVGENKGHLMLLH